MPKCLECDRAFKNAHALKIHTGRMHGESRPAKRRKRRVATKVVSTQAISTAATGPNLARISTPDIVAELSRRARSLDKVRDLIGG